MDTNDQVFEFEFNGAQAKIFLREAGLKAFLELNTVKGKFNPTDFDYAAFEGSVCDWIETKLSIKFIDAKILKTSFLNFKQTHTSKERKIAQGQEPKHGTDGKLLLLVKPFKESFEGEYNFNDRYIKKFDIISKGTIVARLYKPKEGVDGIDVFNKKIEFRPGTEVAIELSPLLSLKADSSANYNEILALEDGFIRTEINSKKSVLNLETVLKYRNGVNHGSGSAIFISNIEVLGDVMEGFTVDAGKDVLIKGNVYQSNVTSKLGSVTIEGSVIDQDISDESFDDFIIGNAENQHTIKARQNISLFSAQNARIFSQSNIFINGSCVRSHVYAGGMITCTNAAFASRLSSACGIEAKQVGNETEVKTIIEFLHPFEAGIEYVELKKTEERLSEKIKKLELFIGPYLESPALIKKLQLSHKNKIVAACNELTAIKTQITKIKNTLSSLHNEGKQITISHLNCTSVCYPGVWVKAGECTYEFSQVCNKKFSLIFDWNTKQFNMCDYKTITCDIS